MKLGEDFVAALIPRQTQVFAAEAIAALVAPILTPELLEGRQLLWFVDNEAAVSSLIRGGSRAEDVGRVALAAHVAMHRIDATPWFEWIDTHSNLSDGLSRLGVQDPWTVSQRWILHEWSEAHLRPVLDFLREPALLNMLVDS